MTEERTAEVCAFLENSGIDRRTDRDAVAGGQRSRFAVKTSESRSPCRPETGKDTPGKRPMKERMLRSLRSESCCQDARTPERGSIGPNLSEVHSIATPSSERTDCAM